jgi:hypothetical protein
MVSEAPDRMLGRKSPERSETKSEGRHLIICSATFSWFVREFPGDMHRPEADMNAELQLLLVSRYRDLLALESGPLGEPGMAFTYRVGATGWLSLLDRFCQDVTAITRRQGPAGPPCRITDIKEKMGALRIVCDGANERIEGLIKEARLESARTCQICGSYGTLHVLPGNVAATLCEADAERLSRPLHRR